MVLRRGAGLCHDLRLTSAMGHILVVDDNPTDRALARSVLEKLPDLHVEFASNGLEAIEHLESTTPLAIVTDLQMPEMDGLSLVRTVRRRFPTIPVLLMTAHGSESLAVEALVAGAADYVPKQRLASDLARAVKGLLSAPLGSRQHQQLAPHWRYSELRYELPSNIELIPLLVDHLSRAATNSGAIESAEQMRLAKCLTEALRNAIIHGRCAMSAQSTSQSPAEACVAVTVELAPHECRFVIRDQGPGFAHSNIVDPRSSPTLLIAGTGKGLALIQLFMDEVRFNRSGNEITLIKRCPTTLVPSNLIPQ